MSSAANIKEQLKKNSEEAVQKGAFGAPTFYVREEGSNEEEMFVGSDRFDHFCHIFNLPWHGPKGIQSKL